MGKQKHKSRKVANKPKPLLPPAEESEQKKPEDPSLIEIGDSPVPGLTLRQVLRGHTNATNRFAWSPDGQYLASPSDDKTIRIWDLSHKECITIFKGHTDQARHVTWSPDSQIIASAGKDSVVLIWDIQTGKVLQTIKSHANIIPKLAWSPDGKMLAMESQRREILLLDTISWKVLQTLAGHSDFINSIKWSPDGRVLISGSANDDKEAKVWNPENGKVLKALRSNKYPPLWCIAWSSDGHLLAAGNGGAEVHIWNTETWQGKNTLEAHTSDVTHVSFSYDNSFLVSQSIDNMIILWRTDTWQIVATLARPAKNNFGRCAEFHPHFPFLATPDEEDTIIRIWELDEAVLLGQAQKSVHYTTAKLVLVGDSGVGKTGLGWRLAHGEFKEHSSTHGQQFWAIPQLGLKRKDGTECEAVLWDLAGQHVYRQIHSIFLDNVAAALVLFDPSNRQDPLKGVEFWLEQLKGKGQLPPTVLVGARVDRGAPALSQQELDQFCQRYGIRGGYLSTSAMNGEGLEALLEELKAQIPWEQMTATVTTVTFKRIKD